MMTIEQIIEGCGGVTKVAAAIGKSRDAVYKWPRIGIPDRHWATLIDLFDGTLTADTIFGANQLARGEPSPPAETGEAA